jgi:hypothetical protein
MISKKKLGGECYFLQILYPLYYIVVIDYIIALSINFENC